MGKKKRTKFRKFDEEDFINEEVKTVQKANEDGASECDVQHNINNLVCMEDAVLEHRQGLVEIMKTSHRRTHSLDSGYRGSISDPDSPTGPPGIQCPMPIRPPPGFERVMPQTLANPYNEPLQHSEVLNQTMGKSPSLPWRPLFCDVENNTFTNVQQLDEESTEGPDCIVSPRELDLPASDISREVPHSKDIKFFEQPYFLKEPPYAVPDLVVNDSPRESWSRFSQLPPSIITEASQEHNQSVLVPPWLYRPITTGLQQSVGSNEIEGMKTRADLRQQPHNGMIVPDGNTSYPNTDRHAGISNPHSRQEPHDFSGMTTDFLGRSHLHPPYPALQPGNASRHRDTAQQHIVTQSQYAKVTQSPHHGVDVTEVVIEPPWVTSSPHVLQPTTHVYCTRGGLTTNHPPMHHQLQLPLASQGKLSVQHQVPYPGVPLSGHPLGPTQPISSSYPHFTHDRAVSQCLTSTREDSLQPPIAMPKPVCSEPVNGLHYDGNDGDTGVSRCTENPATSKYYTSHAVGSSILDRMSGLSIRPSNIQAKDQDCNQATALTVTGDHQQAHPKDTPAVHDKPMTYKDLRRFKKKITVCIPEGPPQDNILFIDTTPLHPSAKGRCVSDLFPEEDKSIRPVFKGIWAIEDDRCDVGPRGTLDPRLIDDTCPEFMRMGVCSHGDECKLKHPSCRYLTRPERPKKTETEENMSSSLAHESSYAKVLGKTTTKFSEAVASEGDYECDFSDRPKRIDTKDNKSSSTNSSLPHESSYAKVVGNTTTKFSEVTDSEGDFECDFPVLRGLGRRRRRRAPQTNIEIGVVSNAWTNKLHLKEDDSNVRYSKDVIPQNMDDTALEANMQVVMDAAYAEELQAKEYGALPPGDDFAPEYYGEEDVYEEYDHYENDYHDNADPLTETTGCTEDIFSKDINSDVVPTGNVTSSAGYRGANPGLIYNNEYYSKVQDASVYEGKSYGCVSSGGEEEKGRLEQDRREDEAGGAFHLTLCDICMDRPKNASLLCGHRYCYLCACQMRVDDGQCAFCKRPIITVIKTFN